MMKTHETAEKTIDTKKICGLIAKISNDLTAVRGIKTKLTSIGNTAEGISEDIKALEKNIRESLNELQNVLGQNNA